MQRRDFLRHAFSWAAVVSAGVQGFASTGTAKRPSGSLSVLSFGQRSGPRPVYSVVPVVGDGRWIWKQPPENQTGYLDPRSYELKVGIRLQGTGGAVRIQATTPVPLEYPEQKIENVRLETQGCEAGLREIESGAGQLGLSAPRIEAGQVIAAVATYRLTLHKQYQGFEKAMFPREQRPPTEIRKRYLQNSPGVETNCREVQVLVRSLASPADHPWDQARRFASWSAENIQARLGPYTSVAAAIRDRVGDCEERSAVFVALCRAVGIPARLVWIPNHNWSEFYLTDEFGVGHWIPAHTACYSWFGWVGAHELILQKGDRVYVPERRRHFRLLDDWARWSGAAPEIHWTAELVPQPSQLGEDPGPGARRKDGQGEWVLTGSHESDQYMRR